MKRNKIICNYQEIYPKLSPVLKMGNKKLIKELYKKSAFIDDLYFLLWDCLKESGLFFESKAVSVMRFRKMKWAFLVKEIISGYQKRYINKENAPIDEDIVVDFLLDTNKATLIDFLASEHLDYLHSNQDILLLVMDSIYVIIPDKPDKLLEENGSYTHMLFIMDVMRGAAQQGYFKHFEVGEKQLIDWFNNLPAEGMEFLRIMVWRTMKALNKLKNS